MGQTASRCKVGSGLGEVRTVGEVRTGDTERNKLPSLSQQSPGPASQRREVILSRSLTSDSFLKEGFVS